MLPAREIFQTGHVRSGRAAVFQTDKREEVIKLSIPTFSPLKCKQLKNGLGLATLRIARARTAEQQQHLGPACFPSPPERITFSFSVNPPHFFDKALSSLLPKPLEIASGRLAPAASADQTSPPFSYFSFKYSE